MLNATNWFVSEAPGEQDGIESRRFLPHSVRSSTATTTPAAARIKRVKRKGWWRWFVINFVFPFRCWILMSLGSELMNAFFGSRLAAWCDRREMGWCSTWKLHSLLWIEKSAEVKGNRGYFRKRRCLLTFGGRQQFCCFIPTLIEMKRIILSD